MEYNNRSIELKENKLNDSRGNYNFYKYYLKNNYLFYPQDTN